MDSSSHNKPLPAPPASSGASSRRTSHESESSVSTTSIIFERIGERVTAQSMGIPVRTSGATALARAQAAAQAEKRSAAADRDRLSDFDDDDPMKDEEASADYDLETGPFLGGASRGADGDDGYGADGAVTTSKGGYKKMDKGMRRVVIIVSLLFVAMWVGGLFLYVSHKSYKHGSEFEHDPQATASRGSLRKVTRDQLDEGFWSPKRASIQWVAGPDGEDGLVLETRGEGKGYLTVEDVRALHKDEAADTPASSIAASRTLVEADSFRFGATSYAIGSALPSKNMKKVLLAVHIQSNWRHSRTASYFVLDVASQAVQPLVPGEPEARVQLAQWAPTSDAISYTRDNNLYLRPVTDTEDTVPVAVKQITTDGGAELFYGVPDWVYEEEVFGGSSATWWSPDGRYLAFLRTNETGVPEYPVQYFEHRPSGTHPKPGEEQYPEVRQIKYPKAGAHNPVVDLQFYDVAAGDVFAVDVSGDFADDDRLITTVLWAGARKVLVKETNRVSNVMRVVVVDVGERAGKAVRTVDVGKLDGGWFEISQTTRYVPADPARNRSDDGYIDTVIYNNGDHLAYFSPPDNPEPVMLTEGPDWEVVDAPSAVDLARNLVYFVATKEGSTQRHVYSVRLQDGGDLAPLTNTSAPGYYHPSFSAGGTFLLLDYSGPGIPWQRVQTTPAAAAEDSSGSAYQYTLEDNRALAERARKYALPLLVYGTLEVEGVALNYVERRPPHFSASKQYPVLFQQYSGPGSQQVARRFSVDFQSYVASSLGYVVVTVDPRGTGFIGRANRVLVRGQLGVTEAHDQIAAAQHWASLPYVDAARLCIWGWSYGGFMTLKTLEQDAGRTFRYGMSVAPVTDWRFYDSIYTERYMDTPQANAAGYDASAIQNVTALGQNERFLLMHGVADDNVHLQNSLALLDRLDLAGVSNYDVHVFPDSDHGISFHNAHQIVYDKLENWLINAFNGEWIKVGHAQVKDKFSAERE